MFVMRQHEPLKTLVEGSRSDKYPSMAEASKRRFRTRAVLFYERGYYGLVWFEKGVRHVRDLKGRTP